MKLSSKHLGHIGEFLACCYLRLKGYRILHRSYQHHFAEIDIIAKKKNVIIFIEVKSRRQREALIESISITQQQRISRAATAFMQKPQYNGCAARFDAFFYCPPLFLKHFIGAWE